MPRWLTLMLRGVALMVVVAMSGALFLGASRDVNGLVQRLGAPHLAPVPDAVPPNVAGDLDQVLAVAWSPSWGHAIYRPMKNCGGGEDFSTCADLTTDHGLSVQISTGDGMRLRSAACFPLGEARAALALQRLADSMDARDTPAGLPPDLPAHRVVRVPDQRLGPASDLLVLDGTTMQLMHRGGEKAPCLAVVVPWRLTQALLLAEAGLPLRTTGLDQVRTMNALAQVKLDPAVHAMPVLTPVEQALNRGVGGADPDNDGHRPWVGPRPGPLSVALTEDDLIRHTHPELK